MTLRVLHIGTVGAFGGSSRSLYEALRCIPKDSMRSFVMVPDGNVKGYFAQFADEMIVTGSLTRFDHTRITHYRGTRWLIVLREIANLPGSLWAVWKAKRRWQTVDIIHVNDTTDVIVGLAAQWLFKVPMMVHARALLETDRHLWRTRWLHRFLRSPTRHVIAIDENVRETLPADILVSVIHNSFEPPAYSAPPAEFVSATSSLQPDRLTVGFVGNMHLAKGVSELVAAAARVKQMGKRVQYLVVGASNAKDTGFKHMVLKALGLAQNAGEEFRAALTANGLADDFILVGHMPAIEHALAKMDVLAFPSHFDAPGRPVFEAASFGVPSIVAVSRPKADTVQHGETAYAIPASTAEQLADAIAFFADNPGEAKRMGANARSLFELNFRAQKNADALLDLYRQMSRAADAQPAFRSAAAAITDRMDSSTGEVR